MRPSVETFKSRDIPIIFDGPKGTFLKGHLKDLKDPLCPVDVLNLEKPEVVKDLHRQFIEAGSQIIQTVTFRSNRISLDGRGIGEKTREINSAAARIAREVAGNEVYVAGNIGPTGSTIIEDLLKVNPKLTLDDLLKDPIPGTISKEQAFNAFKPQVEGLLDGGNIDFFHIETMSSINEVEAAIEAIREVNSDIPIMVTMTFDRDDGNGNLRSYNGVKPAELFELAKKYNIFAYGANCGIGPEGSEKLMLQLSGRNESETEDLISKIKNYEETNNSPELDILFAQIRRENPEAVLVSKFNAGLPETIDEQEIYPATPKQMADHARRMQDMGVKVIGVCCGGEPEDIKAMAEAVRRN